MIDILWKHKDEILRELRKKYSHYDVKFLGKDVEKNSLIYMVGIFGEMRDPRIGDMRIEFTEKDLRKLKIEKINEKKI